MKKTSERILTIDIMRGYFLFAIIIDHLGRFFGFYDIFTGRGTQWVSVAEGFFFVSGMMIGLVRARKLAALPFKESVKKVWQRAGILYLWSVGLTAVFTLLAFFYHGYPGLKDGAYYHQGVIHFIIVTLSLRYTYGWADYLLYYAIYLFFTPLAIWWLRQRLWYVVLGSCVLIWALGNNLQLSWQLLFFGGTIIGYYLKAITGWFSSLPRVPKRIGATFLVALTSITMLLSFFLNTVIDVLHHSPQLPRFGIGVEKLFQFNATRLAPLFNKYTLPPSRLALFMLWFGTMYMVIRHFERPIARSVGKLLIPFGQNSLYVYIVHSFIVFFSQLVFPYPTTPVWFNILFNTAVLAVIWLMVHKKLFFKIIPR